MACKKCICAVAKIPSMIAVQNCPHRKPTTVTYIMLDLYECEQDTPDTVIVLIIEAHPYTHYTVPPPPPPPFPCDNPCRIQ